MIEDIQFVYRARRADGGEVTDTLRARDRTSALLQLEQSGMAAISLKQHDLPDRHAAPRRRRETETERLLVLHQIAVLARAGIPIAEAVESIAQALCGSTLSQRLADAGKAMRRGETITSAFQSCLPHYPAHVYALIRIGEANGALAEVLEEAVGQLRHQSALRRDVVSALTYPAFLLAAALAAVAFMLVVVVPRFAAMLGPQRDTLNGLSRTVLDVGLAVHGHPAIAIALLLATAAAVSWCVATPQGRNASLKVISRWPVTGPRITALQRANWARLMALASTSGVSLLDAASLSFAAVPPGRFRNNLSGSVHALRRGEPIADAFSASGALDAIDRSLLHTGQATGRIGAMFTVIADRHEDSVRTDMKRVTALLEQAAIIMVAAAVGAIVIGIVGAMTSVYDVVQ